MCKCINKKNDARDEKNNPTALIAANFKLLFFFELINWMTAKTKVK